MYTFVQVLYWKMFTLITVNVFCTYFYGNMQHYIPLCNSMTMSLKVGLHSGTSSQQLVINLFNKSFGLPGKEGRGGMPDPLIKKSNFEHGL